MGMKPCSRLRWESIPKRRTGDRLYHNLVGKTRPMKNTRALKSMQRNFLPFIQTDV